jgi:hypothetical protein
LLPELSVGYISVGGVCSWSGEPDRHIRLDAMLDQKRLKEGKQRHKSLVKLKEQLIWSAVTSLKKAKTVQDELETLYDSFTDWDAVNELAAKHAGTAAGC